MPRFALVAQLAFLLACTRSPAAVPVPAIELPWSPGVNQSLPRWSENGWRLHRSDEALRFYIADVPGRLSPSISAEVVPLANGNRVASFYLQSSEYEYLTCFLELEGGAGGWSPRGVGLMLTHVGWSWLDDLEGSVTLDRIDPGPLLCHVELVGRWGERHKPARFERDFCIDPEGDSAQLRAKLEQIEGSPAVR